MCRTVSIFVRGCVTALRKRTYRRTQHRGLLQRTTFILYSDLGIYLTVRDSVKIEELPNTVLLRMCHVQRECTFNRSPSSDASCVMYVLSRLLANGRVGVAFTNVHWHPVQMSRYSQLKVDRILFGILVYYIPILCK